MSGAYEFWNVERFVDLGNETFWHEVAHMLRRAHADDDLMMQRCRLVGEREAGSQGARWRVRVVHEETIFDSEVQS